MAGGIGRRRRHSQRAGLGPSGSVLGGSAREAAVRAKRQRAGGVGTILWYEIL